MHFPEEVFIFETYGRDLYPNPLEINLVSLIGPNSFLESVVYEKFPSVSA